MHTQGTHYPFILIVKMPEKWLSSTYGKSDKKESEDYILTTCISSDHVQITSEVSKESA